MRTPLWSVLVTFNAVRYCIYCIYIVCWLICTIKLAVMKGVGCDCLLLSIVLIQSATVVNDVDRSLVDSLDTYYGMFKCLAVRKGGGITPATPPAKTVY